MSWPSLSIRPASHFACFNEVSDYATTTDGASDLCDLVAMGIEFGKKFSSKIRRLESLAKLQIVAGITGSALVFPDIIGNVNDLRNKVVKPLRRRSLPTFKELRKIVAKSMILAGNAGEAAIFLHEMQIVKLGKRLVLSSFAMNAGFAAADTIDLLHRLGKIKKSFFRPHHRVPRKEKQIIQLKSCRNSLKILQDLSSISMGGVGLATLFCGASFTGFGVTFGLPAAYLGLNIVNHFFGKYIKFKVDNYS